MTILLAQTQPVLLLSVYKPIMMAVALFAWVRMTTYFDQDLRSYSGPHQQWNSIQIVAGMAGFGLWLALPQFWIGLVAAAGTVGGAAGGYVIYRNRQMPTAAMWTLRPATSTHRKTPVSEWSKHRITAVFTNPHGHPLKTPTGHNPASRAHYLFEEMIGFILARHIEQIDILVSSQSTSVKVFIDGIDYPQPGLGQEAAAALIDYLKHVGGLDVSDKRRMAATTLRIDTEQAGSHALGLKTSGSMQGLVMSLKIDSEARIQRDFDPLGLLPTQKQQLQSVLQQDHRTVIVACPPGQGQTTTLYSLLRQHDPYVQNIVTLEDDIPFEVEGVSHHLIQPGTETKQIDKMVTSLLRQDPQVLMLTHLTENVDTSQLLANTAREARLYIGTRHTDTFSALKGWLTWVKDPQIAADALGAIVAGHTLRILCPDCRRSYTPQSSLLKKLNLSPHRVPKLYKDAGRPPGQQGSSQSCQNCWGLGYKGRVGVYEVMPLDDDARRFIANLQFDQLRTHLRKHKMLWLQEAALAKAIEGITTIDEITRVLGKQPVPVQE